MNETVKTPFKYNYYQFVPGYMDFYNLYFDMAYRCQNGDILCELGSFMGRSACFMMESLQHFNKTVKFHAIDLFKITPDEGDGQMPWSENAKLWSKRMGGSDKLLDSFLFYTKNSPAYSYLTNYIQESSDIAAQKFEDNSVFFCFVDASHLYENAKKDILAWWPKIKSGGYLAGHDIGSLGVQQALREFISSNNLQISTDGIASWIISKK